MRDTITIGTIAGFIGTVGMHATNVILKYLGIVKITTLQMASNLFLNWEQANTLQGAIIGGINHFFIGTIVGVTIAFTLRYFGKDYYLLKGLGITGIGYLIGMGFIAPLINIVPQVRADSLTLLGHIAAFTVYGLVTPTIIAYYSDFTVRS